MNQIEKIKIHRYKICGFLFFLIPKNYFVKTIINRSMLSLIPQ